MALGWFIFVLCVTSTTSLTAKVRLAGNNSLPHAGRLEIYYNNTWGTASTFGFDDREVRVACYMLGFGRYGLKTVLAFRRYGRGSGPVWLDRASCTGNEVSLAECGGFGFSDRSHLFDQSIMCDNSNCSTSHPGCDVVWNTNVRNLYRRLLNGSLSRYQLRSFCSAWNNCSKNLQREGCTFYNLSIKVLNYSEWRQFIIRDLIQQKYNEVVDSMYHLCSNMEPYDEVYRPCYQSPLYSALQYACYYYNRNPIHWRYYDDYMCSRLQSVKYCYAKKIQENCNASSADFNMFKMIIYGSRLLGLWSSCAIDFNRLIGNKRNLGELVCSMPNVTVRLVGNNNSDVNAGRLEIYYNDTWRSVRYDTHDKIRWRIDKRIAQVACYMLGCGRSGYVTHEDISRDSGPMWLGGVQCTGNELSLAECAHYGWDVRSIGRYTLRVSIICHGNCSMNPIEHVMLCDSGVTTTAEGITVMSQAISVDGVWPFYGPLAGGTRVTITGQFQGVSTVTAVYFGQHEGSIDTLTDTGMKKIL